jgi:F-type H+-transporting ATPase subunit b
MPQINQLSTVFNSQLFWLFVVFGIIYFVIARTMVPKVRSVMDGRSERIAKEIARAEAARAVAEEAQEAWALRLERSRSEAAAVAQEARRAAARENEAMVNAAVAKINLKLEAAERNIRKAAADIREEMVGVAADAAQDLVKRLTGISVAKDEALEAVTAELELMAKPGDRADGRHSAKSDRRAVEKVR